jgi:hypothetical protein
MASIMKIRCGKEAVEVIVKEDETVGGLKAKLAEETGYTTLKLIYAGKVLKDDLALISSIPGGVNAKLSLVGSNPLAHPTTVNVNERRVVDDLTDRDNDGGRQSAPGSKRVTSYSAYRFHAIQTLPGLPMEEKARGILEELASDPGVLAVMEKFKWSVGALCELYPEGYVGVSDVCVMGLNENKGQRILLRLRTDDMKGFRKILTIKKVLCHEMAHNVHGDHDSSFYVLMRQIERDVVALDWRNSKGRTMDGATQPDRYISASKPSAKGPEVHRLGGDPGSEFLQHLLPPRLLAGTAAILRLTAEEKEVEDKCGSTRSVLPPVSGSTNANAERKVEAVESAPDDAMSMTISDAVTGGAEEVGESLTVGEVKTPALGTISITDGAQSTVEMKMDVVHVDIGSADSAGAEVHSISIGAESMSTSSMSMPAVCIIDWAAELTQYRHDVLANVDDAVAFALSMESTAAPVERLLALRDALDNMLTTAQSQANAGVFSRLLSCVRTLHKIVTNAKNNPDPKYRTIKKSASTYQRLVAQVAGAAQVLRAAGFEDSSGSGGSGVSSGSSESGSGGQIVLRRDDPGWLYVCSSVLEVCVQGAESIEARHGAEDTADTADQQGGGHS